jgi:hypothetical protein
MEKILHLNPWILASATSISLSHPRYYFLWVYDDITDKDEYSYPYHWYYEDQQRQSIDFFNLFVVLFNIIQLALIDEV